MKLYETGHCFAKFRSFCETEKNTKIQKKCLEVVSKTEKHVLLRSFAYFSLNFYTFSSNSVPLFQFRTLQLSFAPVFELCTSTFF